MTARILNGREIARQVLDALGPEVAELRTREIVPHLAFVMIGASRPAEIYVERLEKTARPAGILVSRRRLEEGVSDAELDREVAALNADRAVDGILVQMPLPRQLHPSVLSHLIDVRKDVDGITIENAGRLYLGLPGHPPTTASAIMAILDASGIDVSGMHAVVVGRSAIVGHPVAELLLNRDATVTVVHKRTRDLGTLTRLADLLVVAAGSPGLIAPDMVKAGAVVIDAGINATSAGVVGDVQTDAVAELVGAITPVPGGVGPVTNAVLLRSVVESATRR